MITRNLITRVLTICHVKFTQSTAFQAALPSYSTTSHLLSFLAPLTPLLGDAELPLVAALLGLLSPSAIQLFTYGNSANSLNV